MKKSTKINLTIFGIIIFAIILLFGYFGFIPGLSNILGANKAKDLGIKSTKADWNSAIKKDKISYSVLPASTPDGQSIQRTGKQEINTSWTNAEMTAYMNYLPWKNWPYKNVQFKANSDGSVEISGNLIKERLSGYGAAVNIPSQITNYASKYLPADPAFYIKGKSAMSDNKLTSFDLQAISINKISLPVNMILAMTPKNLIEKANAQTTGNITNDLSNIKGKKGYIIDYINSRFTQIPGFYGKKVYFENGKLVFTGSLYQNISMVK